MAQRRLAVRVRPIVVALAATVCAAVVAAPVQAAEPGLQCRATGLDLTLPGSSESGLFTANPGLDPCTEDSATPAGPAALPLGVTATGLHSSTTVTGTAGPRRQRKAGATVSVESLQVAADGLPTVAIASLAASASAGCDGATPELTAGSSVVGLTIGGVPVDPTVAQSFSVLGLTVEVTPPQETRTATAVTLRALRIKAAPTLTPLAPVLDLAIGEVSAGLDEGRCALPTVTITDPGEYAAPGGPVTALVTAPPGETVVACSITITPVTGGASRTLPSSYDAAAGTCRGTLPDDLPDGEYVITVVATDSGGGQASDSRTVMIRRPVADPGAPTTKPGDGPTASGGPPADPFKEGDLVATYLACQPRAVVLLDVAIRKGRVRLLGAARDTLVGRTVQLRMRGRKVAQAKVGPKGRFRASAPLPPRRIRESTATRYTARIGRHRSRALKLVRRAQFLSGRSHGGKVVLRGRVTPPFAGKRARVSITRWAGCSDGKVVARTRLDARGRFRAVVRIPRGVNAALFRASTLVRSRGNLQFRTYTLPLAVKR